MDALGKKYLAELGPASALSFAAFGVGFIGHI
jgi:hypothetical protein